MPNDVSLQIFKITFLESNLNMSLISVFWFFILENQDSTKKSNMAFLSFGFANYIS